MNLDNNNQDYNRKNPLFERARVPCEFLTYTSQGNVQQTKREHYTLRILEGRRFSGHHGTERSIRFEISDECCHVSSESDTNYNPQQRKEPAASSPRNEPILGDDGARPPVMMQRRPQPFCSNTEQYLPHQSQESMMRAGALRKGLIRLYELEVRESDFGDLRRDQALLVDFSDFAQSFISLLNYCDLGVVEGDAGEDTTVCVDFRGSPSSSHLFSPNNSTAGGHSNGGGKYTCRIEDLSQIKTTDTSHNTSSYHHSSRSDNKHNDKLSKSARFSIVESNQFRELTHLSLNLQSGNDSSIRSYLSSRLSQTMEFNSLLKYQLKNETNTRQQFEQQHSQLEITHKLFCDKTEHQKREWELSSNETLQSSLQYLQEKHDRIVLEKETLLSDIQKTHDRKLSDESARVRQLEQKTQSLACENLDGTTQIQNLQNQLQFKIEENTSLAQDIASLRTSLRQNETERQQYEKSLHQTQLRVAALEKSNESQERTIEKSEKLVQFAQEQSKNSEQNSELHRMRLEETQTSMREISSELDKSRELLDKFRKDRVEMKKKILVKVDILKRQEIVLKRAEGDCEKLQKELDSERKEKQLLQDEFEGSGRDISEYKRKLGESAKLLESNQQVIMYLNKEMNEVQFRGGGGGGGAGYGNNATGSVGGRMPTISSISENQPPGKSTISSSLGMPNYMSSAKSFPPSSSLYVTPNSLKGVTDSNTIGSSRPPYNYSRISPTTGRRRPLSMMTNTSATHSDTCSSVAVNQSHAEVSIHSVSRKRVG